MAMSAATKFGQKIKKARELRGVSQEGLAKELDLSRISINNYEQGKQVPNLDTAIKIALYLKIELDDLVKEVGESSLEFALNNMKDKELSHKLKDALLKTLRRDNEYKKS